MKSNSHQGPRIALHIFALAIVLFTTCFGSGQRANAQESEQAASLNGWFYILQGDGPDRQQEPQNRYLLRTEEGTVIPLALDEAVARSAGGVLALDRQQVDIQGLLTPGMETLRVTAIAPAQGLANRAAEPKAVTGSHPWISIMCKFSDYSTEPKNLTYFQNMYSSSSPGLDHYWREVSFNNANVSGSGAVGWYTLPQPRSYYVYNNALDFGRAATDCTTAADAAVNFANYDGINLMFNYELDGYAWGGTWYLTLDGISKYWNMTWEPPWGYASITVMSHEMGHGFGLPHSSGAYGQTYDNRWDVMSDTWTDCANSTDPTYGCLGQHTISYHKDILGWIASGEKYIPPSGGGTNTITLEQLAQPQTSNYKMAQISIGGSSTHFYTVEVRRKVGYDVKLPGQAVIIHEVDTTRVRPAYVLDPDNNGNTGDAGAMWVVGETFTDSTNGISVSILAATSTGFQVSITTPASLPGAFNKSSPSNGALNQSSNLSLSWGVSSGATSYEYCYDTSNDNACGGTWVSVGSSTSVALSGLPTGSYYWHVRARNTAGVTYANGGSTVWWWFHVLAQPGPFNKISPPNGAGGFPASVMLTWSASTDAASYSYCYDTSNDNACGGSWVNVGVTGSVNLNGLNTGAYYWQVRAQNANGTVYADGSSTAWWAFSVLNVPTGLTMSNQSVLENQPPGATVGTFSTVDADTVDTFVYTLVSGPGSDDNAAFSISGDQLLTAQPFNYLTRNVYTVRVRTTDSSGAIFEQNFIITIADGPPLFTDVSASYWAAAWIERLANAGFTGGCGGGRYCPEESVTRAQMAVFLLKGMYGKGYTPPVPTGTVFGDVPINHWAAAWIEQMSNAGISGGCGNGNFCPDQAVTRGQMAVFLGVARHGTSYTPPPAVGLFTDVPIGYWADAWIEQLANDGVTSGCGGGNFCPALAVSRAQMAVFLVSTFNLP
ncbi:MAG: S-layer homology domain-containing protein [Chloroflexota bacterium]